MPDTEQKDELIRIASLLDIARTIAHDPVPDIATMRYFINDAARKMALIPLVPDEETLTMSLPGDDDIDPEILDARNNHGQDENPDLYDLRDINDQ